MRVPPLDRRRFLQGLGSAIAAVTVPRPLVVRLGRFWEPVPPIQDRRLKELTARALEAARTAGAPYVDVRLTHDRSRVFPGGLRSTDTEELQAGVRALVNGYWGFASGPIWTPEEMVRLGQEATHQAKTNSLGGSREVDLAPRPVVADGHWVMPVERDPFEVSPFEIVDFLQALETFAARVPHAELRNRAGTGSLGARFYLQEKVFASSDGAYCTQRFYRSVGDALVIVQPPGEQPVRWGVPALSPAGMGWELFTADRISQVRNHSLREEIRRIIEAIDVDLRLPVKPVDVGRYDAVCSAAVTQSMVSGTLAPATELDRALGYEANADGTTYVTDPYRMLGALQVGAPLLTLTADRATPGGVATTQWDDEGVMPEKSTLVKAGVLNDFQTTRESAGWLKERYATLARPWRSNGCARAPSGIAPPMQFAANLSVAPGTQALDYEDFVAGTARGIAVEAIDEPDMDFQASSGEGHGRLYKIERGKKVARLFSAAFLFHASEFWKALRSLGGEASLRRYGWVEDKGEPEQKCWYSLTAPAAVVGQVAFVERGRKA